jgi:hypothetical protein
MKIAGKWKMIRELGRVAEAIVGKGREIIFNCQENWMKEGTFLQNVSIVRGLYDAESCDIKVAYSGKLNEKDSIVTRTLAFQTVISLEGII